MIAKLASPVILCGDFNSVRRRDYTDEEWKILCGIHQIETESLEVIREFGGRDVFDYLAQRLNQTHTQIAKRIDFIFIIEKGKEKVNVRDARRFDVLFSDHFPIGTNLEIIGGANG